MPKSKTIEIHEKPVVDTEELDRLQAEEEAKAAALAKKADEGDKNEENEDDGEEGQPPKTPKTPSKKEIDWETKAKESQKEAMVLREQIKKSEEEKNKKIDITDEYLKEKYPEWDDMTSGEQKAIKKAEVLEQEVQEIKNNANKFNNDREWQEKVAVYVNEELADAFPKIVGREEEFQRFATRPSRKGLPLDDLAKIFLFENPAPEPKKGSLFHQPGGAPAPKSEGLSADDVRVLRTTKPLEYMRLVRDGKIKVKI